MNVVAEAIEFTSAAPNDLGRLALVMERALAARDAQPLPADEASDQSLQALQEKAAREAAHTCVATEGDTIVGFALSHPLVDPEKGITAENTDAEHLSLLMIDPEHWGKRIASMLLDITAERARSAGKQCLTLWTRAADNTRAHTVYAHKGFALTGVTRASSNGMQVQYQLAL